MTVVELQNNGSTAPSELTRHIPVYRFVSVVVGVLTFAVVVMSATWSNNWAYPALALPALGTSCLAMAGALSVWFAKPHTTALGRQAWWHEYVYTNIEKGTTMTTDEYIAAGQPVEGIVVWRYIGSTAVMVSGLVAVLSLLATIIAFGYLTNPI